MSGKLQLVALMFFSFFFFFIGVVLNCRCNHNDHDDPTVYLLKPCSFLLCLSFGDAPPRGQISAPHDIFSLFSRTCTCRISNLKFHSHNFLHSAGQGGSEGRKQHLSASVLPLNWQSSFSECSCSASHHHSACPGQLWTSCHGSSCLDNGGHFLCTNSRDLLSRSLD